MAIIVVTWLKKQWATLLLLIAICTLILKAMEYSKKADANSAKLDAIGNIVTLQSDITKAQTQWNIDHDKRHEDHIHLHEAERSHHDTGN